MRGEGLARRAQVRHKLLPPLPEIIRAGLLVGVAEPLLGVGAEAEEGGALVRAEFLEALHHTAVLVDETARESVTTLSVCVCTVR